MQKVQTKTFFINKIKFINIKGAKEDLDEEDENDEDLEDNSGDPERLKAFNVRLTFGLTLKSITFIIISLTVTFATAVSCLLFQKDHRSNMGNHNYHLCYHSSTLLRCSRSNVLVDFWGSSHLNRFHFLFWLIMIITFIIDFHQGFCVVLMCRSYLVSHLT